MTNLIRAIELEAWLRMGGPRDVRRARIVIVQVQAFIDGYYAGREGARAELEKCLRPRRTTEI